MSHGMTRERFIREQLAVQKRPLTDLVLLEILRRTEERFGHCGWGYLVRIKRQWEAENA